MTQPEKTSLRHAAEAISVTSYLHYREYLEALYTWLKSARDHFSYVQFSEELTLGTSNMVHLCLREKRHLSRSSILKVCAALHLDGRKKAYLDTLHKLNTEKEPEKLPELLQELLRIKEKTLVSLIDKSQLEYSSCWYHPVVRELACMPIFEGNPTLISKHFQPRVSEEQIRKSIVLMLRLGLLIPLKDKPYFEQADPVLSTGHDIVDISTVSYHQQNLDLSKTALSTLSQDEREFGAICMSVSEELLHTIKDKMRVFQREILELVAQETQMQRVVQLNLQFFPISHPIPDLKRKSSTEKSLESSINHEEK
jgi:uncharacterized protein (TIGR02147 family)